MSGIFTTPIQASNYNQYGNQGISNTNSLIQAGVGMTDTDYSNYLTSVSRDSYSSIMQGINLQGVSSGYQAPSSYGTLLKGGLDEARGIAAKKATDPNWKGEKTEKTLREEKQIEVMDKLATTLESFGIKLDAFMERFESAITGFEKGMNETTSKLGDSINRMESGFSNSTTQLATSLNKLETALTVEKAGTTTTDGTTVPLAVKA